MKGRAVTSIRHDITIYLYVQFQSLLLYYLWCDQSVHVKFLRPYNKPCPQISMYDKNKQMNDSARFVSCAIYSYIAPVLLGDATADYLIKSYCQVHCLEERKEKCA